MSERKTTRTLELSESDFASAKDLHAHLARELEFPGHYGANLSALSDCLGDISQPTRIVATRNGSTEWFFRFCTVFARAALENPQLDVRIDDERA